MATQRKICPIARNGLGVFASKPWSPTSIGRPTGRRCTSSASSIAVMSWRTGPWWISRICGCTMRRGRSLKVSGGGVARKKRPPPIPREEHWTLQQHLGLDHIPSNDFSLYDHVLDTIAMVGAVPKRYSWNGSHVDLRTYCRFKKAVV